MNQQDQCDQAPEQQRDAKAGQGTGQRRHAPGDPWHQAQDEQHRESATCCPSGIGQSCQQTDHRNQHNAGHECVSAGEGQPHKGGVRVPSGDRLRCKITDDAFGGRVSPDRNRENGGGKTGVPDKGGQHGGDDARRTTGQHRGCGHRGFTERREHESTQQSRQDHICAIAAACADQKPPVEADDLPCRADKCLHRDEHERSGTDSPDGGYPINSSTSSSTRLHRRQARHRRRRQSRRERRFPHSSSN